MLQYQKQKIVSIVHLSKPGPKNCDMYGGTHSRESQGILERFPLVVIVKKQSVDNDPTDIREIDVRRTVNVASQQQQQ